MPSITLTITNFSAYQTQLKTFARILDDVEQKNDRVAASFRATERSLERYSAKFNQVSASVQAFHGVLERMAQKLQETTQKTHNSATAILEFANSFNMVATTVANLEGGKLASFTAQLDNLIDVVGRVSSSSTAGITALFEVFNAQKAEAIKKFAEVFGKIGNSFARLKEFVELAEKTRAPGLSGITDVFEGLERLASTVNLKGITELLKPVVSFFTTVQRLVARLDEDGLNRLQNLIQKIKHFLDSIPSGDNNRKSITAFASAVNSIGGILRQISLLSSGTDEEGVSDANLRQVENRLEQMLRFMRNVIVSLSEISKLRRPDKIRAVATTINAITNIMLELTKLSTGIRELKGGTTVEFNPDEVLASVKQLVPFAKTLTKAIGEFSKVRVPSNIRAVATSIRAVFDAMRVIVDIYTGDNAAQVQALMSRFDDNPNDSIFARANNFVKRLNGRGGLVELIPNLRNLFKVIASAVAQFQGAKDVTSIRVVAEAIRSVGEFIKSLSTGLDELVTIGDTPTKIQRVLGFLTGRGGLTEGFKKLPAVFKQIAVSVSQFSKIKFAKGTSSGDLLQIGRFLEGIATLIPKLEAVGNIQGFKGEVLRRVTPALTGMVKEFVKLSASIGDVNISKLSRVAEAIVRLAQSVLNISKAIQNTGDLSGLSGAFAELGRLASTGFEQGLNLSRFENAGYEAGEAAWTGTAKAVETQSPSRRYMRIAGDVVAGFVQGIARNLPRMAVAGVKMATAFAHGFTNKVAELTKEFTRLQAQIARDFNEFGDRLIQTGIQRITTGGIAGFFQSQAVTFAADFGQVLKQIQIFGSIGEEALKGVEQAILDFSAVTIFSPQQSADAFLNLQKAGLEVADALQALPIVGNLAAAANLDMAQATDLAIQSMFAFGLGIEDLTAITDAWVGAADISTASVESLAAGMSFAAPSAYALGFSIQEVSAAMALMADVGLGGERAGTGLRALFDAIAAPTDEAKKSLLELGLTVNSFVDDATGDFKSFEEVIGLFATGVLSLEKSGRNQQEIFEILSGLGSRNAVSALLALTKGGDEATLALSEYMDALEEANTAQAVAAGMMDTFKGRMTSLTGSFQTLLIKAITPVLEALEPLVDILISLVNITAALPKPLLGIIAGTVVLATALFTLSGVVALLAGLFVKTIAPGMLIVARMFQLAQIYAFNLGAAFTGIAATISTLLPVILFFVSLAAIIGITTGAILLAAKAIRNDFGGAGKAFAELVTNIHGLMQDLSDTFGLFFDILANIINGFGRLFGLVETKIPVMGGFGRVIAFIVNRLNDGLVKIREFIASLQEMFILVERIFIQLGIADERETGGAGGSESNAVQDLRAQREAILEEMRLLEEGLSRDITVQTGDTLFDLAETYGVTVDELVAANNILDRNFIRAGQKLTIPGVGDTTAELERLEKQYREINAALKDTGVLDLVNEQKSVLKEIEALESNAGEIIIKPGDNLFNLAKEYGVTVQDLLDANAQIKDANIIRAGDTLMIPGLEDSSDEMIRLQKEYQRLGMEIDDFGEKAEESLAPVYGSIKDTLILLTQNQAFKFIFGDITVADIDEFTASLQRLGFQFGILGFALAATFGNAFNLIKLGKVNEALELLNVQLTMIGTRALSLLGAEFGTILDEETLIKINEKGVFAVIKESLKEVFQDVEDYAADRARDIFRNMLLKAFKISSFLSIYAADFILQVLGFTGFRQAALPIRNKIIAFLDEFLDLVFDKLVEADKNLQDIVAGILEVISEFIKEVIYLAGEFVDIIGELKDGTINIFEAFKKTAELIVDVFTGIDYQPAIDALNNFLDFAGTLASDVGGRVLSFLSGAADVIAGYVADLITGLDDAEIDFTPVENIGKDILTGLETGIGDLYELGKTMFGKLIKGVKDVLGIKSPSVEFNAIGVDTAEGFKSGLERVIDASAKIFNQIVDGAKKILGEGIPNLLGVEGADFSLLSGDVADVAAQFAIFTGALKELGQSEGVQTIFDTIAGAFNEIVRVAEPAVKAISEFAKLLFGSDDEAAQSQRGLTAATDDLADAMVRVEKKSSNVPLIIRALSVALQGVVIFLKVATFLVVSITNGINALVSSIKKAELVFNGIVSIVTTFTDRFALAFVTVKRLNDVLARFTPGIAAAAVAIGAFVAVLAFFLGAGGNFAFLAVIGGAIANIAFWVGAAIVAFEILMRVLPPFIELVGGLLIAFSGLAEILFGIVTLNPERIFSGLRAVFDGLIISVDALSAVVTGWVAGFLDGILTIIELGGALAEFFFGLLGIDISPAIAALGFIIRLLREIPEFIASIRISSVLDFFAPLIDALGGRLGLFVERFIRGFNDLADSLSAFFKELAPIALFLGKIFAALGLVGIGVPYLTVAVEGLVASFTALFTSGLTVSQVMAAIGTAAAESVPFLTKVWTAITQIATILFQFAIAVIVFEILSRSIEGLFGVVAGVVDVFTGLLMVINGIATGDGERALEGLKTTFSGFIKVVSEAWKVVAAVIIGVFDGITTLIEIVDALGESFGFDLFSDKQLQVAREKFDSIFELLTTQPLGQIGEDIANGLWDGIKSLATKIGQGVYNLIVQPFKDALQIASPSRVFMGLGRDVMLGFIMGIQSMVKKLISLFKTLAVSILNVFAKTLSSSALQNGLVGMREFLENLVGFQLPDFAGVADALASMATAFGDLLSTGDFGSFIGDLASSFGDLFSSLGEFDIGAAASGLKTLLVDALMGGLTGLSDLAGAGLDFIAPLIDLITSSLEGIGVEDIVSAGQSFGRTVISGIFAAIGALGDVASAGLDIAAPILTAIASALSGLDFEQLGETVGNIAVAILSVIGAALVFAASAASEFATALLPVATSIIGAIISALDGVTVADIADAALSLGKSIIGVITGAINAYIAFGTGLGTAFEPLSTPIIAAISTALSSVDFTTLGDTALALAKSVIGLLGSAISSMATAGEGAVDYGKDLAVSLISAIFNAIAGLTKEDVSAAFEVAKTGLTTLLDFLFNDIFGADVEGSTIRATLDMLFKPLEDAASNFVTAKDNVIEFFTAIGEGVSTLGDALDSIRNGAMLLFNQTKQAVLNILLLVLGGIEGLVASLITAIDKIPGVGDVGEAPDLTSGIRGELLKLQEEEIVLTASVALEEEGLTADYVQTKLMELLGTEGVDISAVFTDFAALDLPEADKLNILNGLFSSVSTAEIPEEQKQAIYSSVSDTLTGILSDTSFEPTEGEQGLVGAIINSLLVSGTEFDVPEELSDGFKLLIDAMAADLTEAGLNVEGTPFGSFIADAATQGFIEGVGANQGELSQAGLDFAHAIMDSITGLAGFNSNSPSIWAMEQAMNVIEGFALGFDTYMPLIDERINAIIAKFFAMENVFGDVVSRTESGFTRLGTSATLGANAVTLATNQMILQFQRLSAQAGDATLKLLEVGGAAQGLDGITISINVVNATAGGLAGGRAEGGSIARNRLYEVNERGAPELFESGGRIFLLSGNDGRVIAPSQAGFGARGGGFGGGTSIVFEGDMYIENPAGTDVTPELIANGVRMYAEGNPPQRGLRNDT